MRAKMEEAANARQRQEQAEAQVRELETKRAETERRASQIAAARALAAPQPVVAVTATRRTSWRDELRDPQGLRRAMVLREILGPPVGLR